MPRTSKSRVSESIPHLKSLADRPADELPELIFLPSSYLFFEPSDFTYQSMQESGDFQLLSDATVKSDILRLQRQYRHIDTLQTNFLHALDAPVDADPVWLESPDALLS